MTTVSRYTSLPEDTETKEPTTVEIQARHDSDSQPFLVIPHEMTVNVPWAEGIHRDRGVLLKRLDAAEAKIDRLTTRGFQDLHHENEELKLTNEALTRELDMVKDKLSESGREAADHYSEWMDRAIKAEGRVNDRNKRITTLVKSNADLQQAVGDMDYTKKLKATLKAIGELERYDRDSYGGNLNPHSDGDWILYDELQALLNRSKDDE